MFRWFYFESVNDDLIPINYFAMYYKGGRAVEELGILIINKNGLT